MKLLPFTDANAIDAFERRSRTILFNQPPSGYNPAVICLCSQKTLH